MEAGAVFCSFGSKIEIQADAEDAVLCCAAAFAMQMFHQDGDIFQAYAMGIPLRDKIA